MWVTMVYRFLCTLLHRAAESERGGSQGAAEEAEGQDSGGVAERVGQNTPQLGGTVSGSIAGSHSWLALQILFPSLSITQYTHIHTYLQSPYSQGSRAVVEGAPSWGERGGMEESYWQ